MKRTTLIANTSNMPVAAREASIILGLLSPNYFRDQGLDVAMMADSTSRWAEALRELSGRLGEMPAGPGLPPPISVPSSLRSTNALTWALLSDTAVSALSALSATLVVISQTPSLHPPSVSSKSFGGLDKKLAQRKHFPSINTSVSYTKYTTVLDKFYEKGLPRVPPGFETESSSSFPTRKNSTKSCSLVVRVPCLILTRLLLISLP
ncbi:H(+)-transporting V1 sector ATPase subunit A [Metarhizium acridum]|nr:H(+)-transporting V1 sector ATPase subunit A [Metarhizium acridum]